MANEPVCIRHAATLEEASIIVAWLAENDVDAKIADPDNPGVMAFGVTDPEGIEVYVKDDETAARAKALLREHDARDRAADDGDELTVTCEGCGGTFHFPAGQAGTTQECPECGAYLDVAG